MKGVGAAFDFKNLDIADCQQLDMMYSTSQYPDPYVLLKVATLSLLETKCCGRWTFFLCCP